MNNTSTDNKQSAVRARVFRAAILSAPLWTAGVLFLSVLFSLAHDASLGSLQFVALSLVAMLVSTIIALRVMDHDLPRVGSRRVLESRSLKMRSRRLRGLRLM